MKKPEIPDDTKTAQCMRRSARAAARAASEWEADDAMLTLKHWTKEVRRLTGGPGDKGVGR